jgi:hypothetical protein
MIDIEGNKYQTIKIGNQEWMAENLKVTKYNDGSDIPLVTDGNEWAALATPAYCYYNNTTNTDSIKKWGALYNWYTVNTKKLAPIGWHIPTDAEWNILKSYLIAVADVSGFSALLGGYRNTGGRFLSQSDCGSWWSATENDATFAYYRNLYYGFDNLYRYYNYKSCGFSVRLVRD